MTLSPTNFSPAPVAFEDTAVSIVILTLNEESNLRECLESCRWSDDVHVVDSGSHDRTRELAAKLGATVHEHPFSSFGEQRNWAIDHVSYKHKWIFHLDADERFTPELVAEIRLLLSTAPPDAGYYVPHKLMFMGKWLRRAEGYPIYQMRLFHLNRMRFTDWGHGQREDTEGRIGKLAQPYLHYNFSKGIADWVDKHNRYSTLEAAEIVDRDPAANSDQDGKIFGSELQRRRFFKARVYPKLPARWLGRFVWMYFCKLGFLDGVAGLHYCLLVSYYELMTTLKIRETRQQRKLDARREITSSQTEANPADLTVSALPLDPTPVSEAMPQSNSSLGLTEHERSQWTFGEKILRVLWMLVTAMLWRTSFHNWYGWRRFLLRRFGAKVGKNVRIRPSVKVEIPWNLRLSDGCAVGDGAILYSLGIITIGRNAVISQLSHLCAGTHDYRKPEFPLIRLPITIGDGAWVAADSFVGPGVTIGSGTVVGARSSVFKSLPPNVVAVGNPAAPIKKRLQDGSEIPVSKTETPSEAVA